MANSIYLGIDLGTQGIRAIVSDNEGNILLSLQTKFEKDQLDFGCVSQAQGYHEQNPLYWREILYSLLSQVAAELQEKSIDLNLIQAICTDSTSGTILAIDSQGNPLGSALMYDDMRSIEENELINLAGQKFCEDIGFQFNPSFSLPKILWIKNNQPDQFQQLTKIIHANDFIVGLLTREFGISDSSNCLKTGYDFLNGCWPKFISKDLQIPTELLPVVKKPGEFIANTDSNLESMTGIPAGIPVLAGATDSTMGLVASGACHYGDIFSSLGTTLVTRILTDQLIRDPQGRAYCQIFPGNEPIYLPGGASSVGAGCLTQYFPGIDYTIYDAEALKYLPTSCLVYPLLKPGERFPFVKPDAEFFFEGTPVDDYERYAAFLQGVAFVERLCVETLEQLGAISGNHLFTVGGGSSSEIWLQLRVDVLNKILIRPQINEAAFGAVIVAVGAIEFENHITNASERMVHSDVTIIPNAERHQQLEIIYQQFCETIQNNYGISIPR